jgi:hypothetical protein
MMNSESTIIWLLIGLLRVYLLGKCDATLRLISSSSNILGVTLSESVYALNANGIHVGKVSAIPYLYSAFLLVTISSHFIFTLFFLCVTTR